MKHNKKQIVWTAVILSLCASLYACRGGNTAKSGDSDLSGYPVKTKDTLTYWMDIGTNISSVYTNFGETEFAKELEKRTGIHVKYVHPAAGQSGEAFSLMVASDDMTDMIKYNWATALGGPTITLNDNVIIKLDDLMDKYAPNLKKYLDTHEDVNRRVQTDDGNYYVFPFIRGDEKLYTSAGLVIRRDWLEKLNLPIPETTDEMETTLRAFKNELGIKAPLTMLKSNVRYLLGMCSSTNTFYVDNGTIKFGPAESEYKDAVIRLNKWFNEGLLDKNYVSTDSTLLDSNMLNGVSGVTYASGGSGVGKWLDTMSSKGESFDIVGIPFLSLKKGESPKFDASDSAYAPYGSTAITSSCKNPELAAKYLDYSYSDEGYMLYNFGIEGVSYTMVDNQPVYTDEIMHNSEGLTVSQAMGKYFVAANEGPFIQDKRCIEQYYARPQQQESLSNWSKFIDTSSLTKLPVLTYTAEESAEYANIMADVTKLVDENTAQLISGTMPLSSYDSYLNSLAELKIERATEIVQTAYNRYLNRK